MANAGAFVYNHPLEACEEAVENKLKTYVGKTLEKHGALNCFAHSESCRDFHPSRL